MDAVGTKPHWLVLHALMLDFILTIEQVFSLRKVLKL